jgi:flagellar hook-associated protein 3 FlgL
MRITDSFRYRTVIQNLNVSRERMTKLQEQLASGKRINRPSDDPEAMANAMRLKTTLDSNEQFQTNISDATTQLTAQEEALDQVYEVLVNLKEIALEGASDSITVRGSLAQQLDLMLKNVLEIANTKYNGKYIFGGTETLSQPFTLNENVLSHNLDDKVVDYRGNYGQVNRQINEETSIPVNLHGKEIFDQSQGEGVDVFQLIYQLKRAMENEDGTTANSKIADVDKAIEQVLKSYLKIGTRKQLVLFNDDRFTNQNIQLQSAMSKLEDTDVADAYVNFKAEENALNSALSAGARVISPSLLDFLGAV